MYDLDFINKYHCNHCKKILESVKPLELYGFNELIRKVNSVGKEEGNAKMSHNTVMKHLHEHLIVDEYATYADVEAQEAFSLIQKWQRKILASRDMNRVHKLNESIISNGEAIELSRDLRDMSLKFDKILNSAKHFKTGKVFIVFKRMEEIQLEKEIREYLSSGGHDRVYLGNHYTYEREEFCKLKIKEIISEYKS